MHDCPFCHKTSEDFILETAKFAVIYNISPILPGHTLVIPKQHKESLFELSDNELAEFMGLGRATAKLVNTVFKTDAYNLAVQEREAAGQSVAHLHMHIVPRTIGDLDDHGAWYQQLELSQSGDMDTFNRFRLTPEQLKELTEKMKDEAQKLSPQNHLLKT